MKKLKTNRLSIIAIFAITLLALMYQPGYSQKGYSNINLARIQREINMMETILGEMLSDGFRTRQPFRDSRVRGLYIPEVGVVFRVSASPYMTSIQYYLRARSGEQGKDSPEVYFVGPGGEIQAASASTYRAMLDSTVFEFLEYYADASGQLADNEQIVIVYEPEPYLSVFSLQGETVSPFSGFTVSAKKTDIIDLRARKLNSRDFRKKIIKTDLKGNRKQNNRLRRFANVCKTMLNDDQNAGYRVYGGVSNLFIEDFGAIFMFDVVQSMNSPYNVILRIQDEIERNEIVVQKLQEIAKKRPDDRKVHEMLATLRIEPDSTRYIKRKQAYSRFEKRVTDLLLDYGRSLQMLDRGQKLTIAVKIRDNTSFVPERVVFQVKKDDLDAYDANKLNRQAMAKRVLIKRYGMNP